MRLEKRNQDNSVSERQAGGGTSAFGPGVSAEATCTHRGPKAGVSLPAACLPKAEKAGVEAVEGRCHGVVGRGRVDGALLRPCAMDRPKVEVADPKAWKTTSGISSVRWMLPAPPPLLTSSLSPPSTLLHDQTADEGL